MAKIDTTKINGYADMSADEKIAALEAFETAEPDYSGYVRKELYDKAASDVAAWKKKHNALLNEDEKKKQEDADAFAAMKQELEALRKDKTISEYKAKLLAQGYDDALAGDTAAAMANGDMGAVFAAQEKFLAQYEKSVKASVLKSTPKPPAGSASAELTQEQFNKMNYSERLKVFNEQPSLYQEMIKNGG